MEVGRMTMEAAAKRLHEPDMRWGDKGPLFLEWIKGEQQSQISLQHSSFLCYPSTCIYHGRCKGKSSVQGLTWGRCPPQNHRSRCELCRLPRLPLPVQSDSSSSASTAEFHTQGTEWGLCSYHHLIWGTSMGQKKAQVIALKRADGGEPPCKKFCNIT